MLPGQIGTDEIEQASGSDFLLKVLPLLIGSPFEALLDHLTLRREVRIKSTIGETSLRHDACQTGRRNPVLAESTRRDLQDVVVCDLLAPLFVSHDFFASSLAFTDSYDHNM